jgi:hypothetical protein
MARRIESAAEAIRCTVESWCLREQDLIIASLALSGIRAIGQ